MYNIKIWDLGEVVEVQKYHHGNYGAPGKKRTPKKKPTPEEVKKVNERHKARKVWRLILANFKKGDWHLILRYKDKPDPVEAKKHLRDFLRDMRMTYKKAGVPFKYIAVTEIGKKGGVHHHLVIEDRPITREAVKQCWKSGSTFWADLYESDDNYQTLAEYLVKRQTKEDVPGCSYSTSRNLIVPKPRVVKRPAKGWREEPKPRKGWYIVKDSLVNGINPVTGTPYQRYLMKRITKERGEPGGG